MHATQVQSQAAGQLIDALLGQSQQSQTALAMKLAKVSLASKVQAPPNTSAASGAGGRVDLLG